MRTKIHDRLLVRRKTAATTTHKVRRFKEGLGVTGGVASDCKTPFLSLLYHRQNCVEANSRAQASHSDRTSREAEVVKMWCEKSREKKASTPTNTARTGFTNTMPDQPSASKIENHEAITVMSTRSMSKKPRSCVSYTG